MALLAAAPAAAAPALAVSVEGLARESAAVVRGRVTAAHAERSADGRRIFTTYDVRADAVLRGRTPKACRVIVPGGVVGRVAQHVDGAPSLARGEEVVLFLRREGADAFAVTALAQGKFSIDGKIARPDLSRLRFVGTSVRGGERPSEEMPLAELERRVRSVR